MLDPHRLDLGGNALRRQIALVRLTAGHGDRVIIENLVGHVGARREGGADRLDT